MPKEGLGNEDLTKSEGVLTSISFLDDYLGAPDILAFSETCRTARDISSDVRKKHALKSLLTAVACGNEDLARTIVTHRPELILDSSAIVKDISGKEIKNLTPLQAAICAGDVDMVQMIKEVLHKKLQAGIRLNFEPEFEMQRQFTGIYPNGIDSVEQEQQLKAQEFKVSNLNDIFTAINRATVEQIKFELDTPGIINTDSQLNTALHNFRDQFTTISNLDQIFNPFYLLEALGFSVEKFNILIGNGNHTWDKIYLFWLQIIGYTQRHLPACYLQTFAQGLSDIAEDGEKLKRDFEFSYDKNFYMRAVVGDLENLGYKYAGAGWAKKLTREWDPVMGRRGVSPEGGVRVANVFYELIANKKLRIGELICAQSHRSYSYLPN